MPYCKIQTPQFNFADPLRAGGRLDSPEVEMSFLEAVHDGIETTTGSVQKTMLKSIVGCLLTGKPRL